ncbi:PspA/IM30 family protein [Zooshikella sp. RANM57]|uniref:PspA/IM30 family protein n=1 Tax=Zooshikella sp. RANM57 TaxID=3425863 RepID=UPI003D6F08D7
MSVWKKLFTAIKGGANEAAEAVADSQALRILDQEMREAKEQLRKSESSLTTILAKQKLADQKTKDLKAAIAEHESYAMQAMEKGDEALAVEIAEKIAEFEGSLGTEQGMLDQLNNSVRSLKASIKDAKLKLRQMQTQVDNIKATASLHKAQEAVSSRHLGANSKMKTAAESLQRIQEKQKQRAAEIEAANDLASEEEGRGLQEKLKAAGIVENQSAQSVLERLKAKKQ